MEWVCQKGLCREEIGSRSKYDIPLIMVKEYFFDRTRSGKKIPERGARVGG